MTGGWFKRGRTRTASSAADDADARIAQQARRAGRSLEEHQETILRDVLPDVRRSVADAGLTMDQYLRLDEAEYHALLAANPGSRSLLSRRHELLDYDTFVRMRRWVEAAAERAGDDPATWATRAGVRGPQRPWERQRPDEPTGAAAGAAAPTTAKVTVHDGAATSGDALLDRLERLAALRDSGALTEDEFLAQKRRLLDGA